MTFNYSSETGSQEPTWDHDEQLCVSRLCLWLPECKEVHLLSNNPIQEIQTIHKFCSSGSYSVSFKNEPSECSACFDKKGGLLSLLFYAQQNFELFYLQYQFSHPYKAVVNIRTIFVEKRLSDVSFCVTCLLSVSKSLNIRISFLSIQFAAKEKVFSNFKKHRVFQSFPDPTLIEILMRQKFLRHYFDKSLVSPILVPQLRIVLPFALSIWPIQHSTMRQSSNASVHSPLHIKVRKHFYATTACRASLLTILENGINSHEATQMYNFYFVNSLSRIIFNFTIIQLAFRMKMLQATLSFLEPGFNYSILVVRK
ncbi:hypothetical protein BD560DRAFT_486342 [Blakeslea trispora]|nr:hypothetical protein BD560DRAFT_486342 [Blakeslea trispora]